MTTLKEAYETLKEAQKIAKSDPMDYPYNTRTAHATRITQMKTELPGLVTKYVQELEKNVNKVFFTGGDENGSKNDSFVKLLSEKATVLASGDVYGEIATRIQPVLNSDGSFGTEAWRRYLEVAGELARKYGLATKEPVKEPAGADCSTFLKLRLTVKKTTEAAFGWDLNKMFIYETMFKDASRTEIKEEEVVFLPIYVDDLAERDIINASAFREKPSYTITFAKEEEVTADTVKQLIKQAKRAIKSE